MGTEVEIIKNKQYRGQVMRILGLFYPTPVSVGNLKQALMSYGITNQADLNKHLYYLEDKGYLKSAEGQLKNIIDDNLISITAAGIDLVEGTTSDDGLFL